MFKNIIEDIKMSKLSYLLEIIKTKDLNEKIKAFKKLDKMKISKEMGLEILEWATYDYGVDDGNGGINSSLISLCMKDYHKEYSDKIKKIFKLLNEDCQNKVVFLLSSIDNEYALDLYVDLILKYYKDSNFIPISNLYERVNSYKLLFPKLYKALKFKALKNNILILINDYLNAGVIPDVDLKKNKKLIQDNISKIFNEALKIKFPNTSKALQNEKYLDLRFFLEIAINIEYYVSNKKTNDLINELFKRNDNQLKLFILENYIRKGKDISKINLESIAKDNASRYPLYDLLTVYEKTNLMPKKYMTGEKIALSDFFINFVLINTYKELPKNIKFVKKKVINNYLYYIFTFKYTYKNNINYDSTTNYLIETTGIDKYKDKKITSTFVGVSGGFNPNKKVSLVETTNNKVLWSKIDNDETIDEVVDRIIPEVKIEKEEDKKSKKNNREFKKLEKAIEKEQKVDEKTESQKDVELKKRKIKFKFGYILTFLLIVLIGTLIVFIQCLKKPESISGDTTIESIKHRTIKISKLENKDKFKEINGIDIYKQPEQSYYVLLYKKKGNKNSYYTYINELIKNGYTIYYVNLSDEKNNFLYDANDLGFTLTGDRYLKVEDGDFSFYVEGKTNIIDELNLEYNSILEAKKANENNKKK